MANNKVPQTGQGPAANASDEDLRRDNTGFTHPNLHRRIDPQQSPEGSEEYQPRKYQLGIYGVNSYRTTETVLHDEDAEDNEIP